MAMETWMLEVNGAGLVKVAEALSLHVDGQILCTGCGHALRSQFAAWHCPHCDTRGNALMYAALALSAANDPWPVIRQKLASRGLCQPAA